MCIRDRLAGLRRAGRHRQRGVAGDQGALVAALGHALLGHDADDERALVARYAALAVAPRSPEAGELLLAHHEAALAAVVEALEVRLAADARRLVPGVALDDLARLVVALGDGLSAQARFLPGGTASSASVVDLVVDRCTEPAPP